MKQFFFCICIIFLAIACDESQTSKPIANKKDTINVQQIVLSFYNNKLIPPGAKSKEAQTVLIVQYDDTNKDSIKASLTIRGIIHPSSIPNPPPPSDYEETIDWVFYNDKGEWKGMPTH
jgi:hypothetical protein